MQPAGLDEAQYPAKKEGNLPDHTGTKDTPHENECIDQTTPIQGKPTLERSWEVIMKEVTSLDEGLVKGWKEDIDTLLVFMGLFSAVVTAFTIESYQWLEQTPEDTNVVLLTQILQKLNNEPISPPQQFKASSSAVRINVLWFLSLAIALVDALFALVCKQWLREHERNVHTHSPTEALALRWLRNQSLEKWRVPTILASLPILLELALFLFLAGVLEFLWIRHRVPFGFAMGVVGFAGLCYIGTAITPAVNTLRQALQVAPGVWAMRFGHSGFVWESPVDFLMRLPPIELVCPYKSPQAWAAFHVIRFMHTTVIVLQSLIFIFWTRVGFASDPAQLTSYVRKIAVHYQILRRLSNWSSVDLELLQRSHIDLAPRFYELNALQWLVEELRDTPIMISHLQNILQTMPLHLVMPAVLGQPFDLPDREWAVGDIEASLRFRPDWASKSKLSRSGLLVSQRSTPLFSHLLHLAHVLTNVEKVDQMEHKAIISHIKALWGDSLHGDLQGMGFPVGLRRIEQLTNNPESASLGFGLRDFFVQTVQLSLTKEYGLTLMQDVGKYIISLYPPDVVADMTATTTSSTSGSSSFIESNVGLEFLSLMHQTIIDQGFYLSSPVRDSTHWMEAMNIVRRVHRLPEDHFPTIPGFLPFTLFSKLKEAFSSLSSAGCHAFHEHLGQLKECWCDASWSLKAAIVMLLADHIDNHPQSNPESYPGLDGWTVSPFVMSPSGKELIAFVDKQFEEDPDLKEYMNICWNRDKKEAWIKAMQRVRHARRLDDAVQIDPEHSEGTSLPFIPNAGDDGNFDEARDEVGVDKVGRYHEKIVPSKPEPSQNLGGGAGVRSLDESRDNEEKESKISQPGGSERGQGDHDLGQKEVGGPGADKNVRSRSGHTRVDMLPPIP
ncbi:hypothetical protein PQX77_016974 [Marasmius sp. AFHP31]|nr:hypothetical protein PQX77_016974 [Marasmius sp. AFHP31]